MKGEISNIALSLCLSLFQISKLTGLLQKVWGSNLSRTSLWSFLKKKGREKEQGRMRVDTVGLSDNMIMWVDPVTVWFKPPVRIGTAIGGTGTVADGT